MNFQNVKENRRKILFTLLTIAFILFIFSNSLRDGTESSAQSGAVLLFIKNMFQKIGITSAITEHFIRKSAHFMEYTALGVLLGLTLRQYTPRILRNIFVPLFIGLAVPVTDEFIQLFSPGRAGMVQDVLLDFSGVLTGLTLTVLGILWHEHRLKARKQGENR